MGVPWLTSCAWCKRVKRGNSWVSEYVSPERENVTHGICPDCHRKMDRQIDKFEAGLSEVAVPDRLGK
jgi:hypothetical protein